MAEDNKKKPDDEVAQELLVPQTPGEITEENAHLVDFDNLKVRLICLVAVENTFAQVANFLKRRGWEVFVTTEIKDALTQASTFKPDFVLMSVNHPHKKINQFPQIITQTFNLPVIAFGEKTDSKTMGGIQTSRASYKIMGHLSGPTAQRKIKQILQEKHQPQNEIRSNARAFDGVTGERKMRFSSDGRKSNSSIKFESREKYVSKGRMIFENNQSSMLNAAELASGYNPFVDGGQQDNGFDESGPAYIPKDQSPEKELESKQKEMAEALKKVDTSVLEKNKEEEKESEPQSLEDLRAAALGGSDGKRASFDDHSNTPSVHDELVEQSFNSSSSGNDPSTGNDESKEEEASRIQEELTEMSFNTEQSGPSIKEDGYTMESEYIPKASSVQNMESDYIGRSGDTRNHVNDIDHRSFIETATIEIVQQMKDDEKDNDKSMGIVSRVVLLSVGHDNHKGYFMIAGHDFGMDLDTFVQQFTAHLKIHCQKHSEAMEFGDYINMDCPNYDFFDNGEEGLEFNYVTNFGSGEVGVKFIHDEEAWAHTETKDNHDKTLIKAEQVVEDKPLEIDLFVHLQRNDKYFKIVSTDSELSAERKERLIEKETEVFINNEDVGTYRSFQTKQKALKAINKTVQRTTKKRAS